MGTPGIYSERYNKIKNVALSIALKNGELRFKDLKSIGSRRIISKYLQRMVVEEKVLEKRISEKTRRPAYYITPKGVGILVVEDYITLFRKILSLEEVGTNFEKLPTEILIRFFEGFMLSYIFSFFYNLTVIKEQLNKTKESMKEAFISKLSEKLRPESRSKKKAEEMFEKIFKLSEKIEKISKREKKILQKQHGPIFHAALKLREIRNENVKDLITIISLSQSKYMNEVLKNENAERMIQEMVKRPDFIIEVHKIMEPYYQRIYSFLKEGEKFWPRDEILEFSQILGLIEGWYGKSTETVKGKL